MSRRLHIAGSASKDCDTDLLKWTHEVLAAQLRAHLREGGTLLAQIGGEPRQERSGLAMTFDWLAIEIAAEAVEQGYARPRTEGALMSVRGSTRGLGQIPSGRRELWNDLLSRDAVDLHVLPDTWRSGALIRLEQARVGDVLEVVSGGAGVEHLAALYAQRGRPVIPWMIDLGSSSEDGTIGGIGLASKALSDAAPFLRLASGAGGEARLAELRVDPGNITGAPAVAERLDRLVGDLAPPSVFCVRLLNPDHSDYDAVEMFFREVVDPTMEGLGFHVVDLGIEHQEAPWMNAEVFNRLHRSELVFADLTAQRANCFTELGYALGNGQRVIVSAAAGESLPFDTDKLPCFSWAQKADPAQTQRNLIEHIDRFGSLPPLVEDVAFV